jgi:hypothetical protein
MRVPLSFSGDSKRRRNPFTTSIIVSLYSGRAVQFNCAGLCGLDTKSLRQRFTCKSSAHTRCRVLHCPTTCPSATRPQRTVLRHSQALFTEMYTLETLSLAKVGTLSSSGPVFELILRSSNPSVRPAETILHRPFSTRSRLY